MRLAALSALACVLGINGCVTNGPASPADPWIEPRGKYQSYHEFLASLFAEELRQRIVLGRINSGHGDAIGDCFADFVVAHTKPQDLKLLDAAARGEKATSKSIILEGTGALQQLSQQPKDVQRATLREYCPETVDKYGPEMGLYGDNLVAHADTSATVTEGYNPLDPNGTGQSSPATITAPAEARDRVIFDLGPCPERTGTLVLHFPTSTQTWDIRTWRDHSASDAFSEVFRIEKVVFEGKPSDGGDYRTTMDVVVQMEQLSDSKGWTKSSKFVFVRDPEYTSGTLDGKPMTDKQLAFMTDGMKETMEKGFEAGFQPVGGDGRMVLDLLDPKGVEIGKVYKVPARDIAQGFVIDERRNALAVPSDKRTDRQTYLAGLAEAQIGEATRRICETTPQTYYCGAALSFQVTPADNGSAPQRWNVVMDFSSTPPKALVRFRLSVEVDRQFCMRKASFINESAASSTRSDPLSMDVRLD
ncbi:hypothetical protein FRZ61_50320 [Hypericibacter adhaerens]|uniref:Uncharacterized protein n=1 Tax=Hypericibacter adhaerens TaxID=2602016 RepID=A0A5J6NAW3_9PROT|nr:hypothetical protein FRZ61_50320 [Hypericibacter adhaerens]